MWIPQPPQSVETGRSSKAGRRSADATDELIDSTMRSLKVHPDERQAEKETLKRREGVRVTTTDIKQHESNATARPMLPNNGAMSTFVGEFDVESKLTTEKFVCRFSHMWNGIATRHADTIDTKFYVNGEAQVVGLAHTAFVAFRDKTGRDLTDREASFIAAEYLRERLEQDDVRPLYDAFPEDVTRLIDAIGIK
ncbi:MAG TPA: hypothetical protein VHP80_19815 [Candidatus Acidoferrum sp.]|jgi:hypothetical protein|nr:hypothetical protein [Candidatus Acidoferrum sp.]